MVRTVLVKIIKHFINYPGVCTTGNTLTKEESKELRSLGSKGSYPSWTKMYEVVSKHLSVGPAGHLVDQEGKRVVEKESWVDYVEGALQMLESVDQDVPLSRQLKDELSKSISVNKAFGLCEAEIERILHAYPCLVPATISAESPDHSRIERIPSDTSECHFFVMAPDSCSVSLQFHGK